MNIAARGAKWLPQDRIASQSRAGNGNSRRAVSSGAIWGPEERKLGLYIHLPKYLPVFLNQILKALQKKKWVYIQSPALPSGFACYYVFINSAFPGPEVDLRGLLHTWNPWADWNHSSHCTIMQGCKTLHYCFYTLLSLMFLYFIHLGVFGANFDF